jgi:hypothetical protein
MHAMLCCFRRRPLSSKRGRGLKGGGERAESIFLTIKLKKKIENTLKWIREQKNEARRKKKIKSILRGV